VVEKPFLMLLSELSNFILNLLRLKVPVEVGVSDMPRCIYGVPKCLVFKSLNDDIVVLFRASPQLYAIGPHRLKNQRIVPLNPVLSQSVGHPYPDTPR
jgi:hypothetical protein